MTGDQLQVWAARSGHLHWLRSCSGGGGARNMTAAAVPAGTAWDREAHCRCLRTKLASEAARVDYNTIAGNLAAGQELAGQDAAAVKRAQDWARMQLRPWPPDQQYVTRKARSSP